MPTPSAPLPCPRLKTISRVLFWTVLTMGGYPIYIAAKHAPQAAREAILARAQHIQSTPEGSSWPWLRKAWAAWVCELCLAEMLALFCGAIIGSMATGPMARAMHLTGHPPRSGVVALYLMALVILAPQGYVLTRLAVLTGQTIWPERLVARLREKRREWLNRLTPRASGRTENP